MFSSMVNPTVLSSGYDIIVIDFIYVCEHLREYVCVCVCVFVGLFVTVCGMWEWGRVLVRMHEWTH